MVTNVHTSVLLEVKNLNVDYLASNGTVHAVTDVNFTLQRGEILGLAGESGSGKSTLAYAITRLLRPPAMITDGEILYYPRLSQDEHDISNVTLTHLSKKIYHSIALVNHLASRPQLHDLTCGYRECVGVLLVLSCSVKVCFWPRALRGLSAT